MRSALLASPAAGPKATGPRLPSISFPTKTSVASLPWRPVATFSAASRAPKRARSEAEALTGAIVAAAAAAVTAAWKVCDGGGGRDRGSHFVCERQAGNGRRDA